MIGGLKRDVLIYGLEFKDVSRPFQIGRFKVLPGHDLQQHLRGYADDVVFETLERNPKYACYCEDEGWGPFETSYPEVQVFAAAFRLLKPGLIQFDSFVTPIRDCKDLQMYQLPDPPPHVQPWAEPLRYELHQAEIPQVRSIYRRLKRVPAGYMDVALKRFGRSYDYWLKEEVDDCFADLVIALESLTSRGGDGISQSMKLRIPLLLKGKHTDRSTLERRISRYYSHRSSILHGGRIDKKEREKRAEIIEGLRGLVRDTIIRCIEILIEFQHLNQLQKTMAETIDAYLHRQLRVRASG